MDITPQDDTTTQPISDDQELAKALAGIADEPEAPAAPTPEPANAEGMQFEEAPAPAAPAEPVTPPAPTPVSIAVSPSLDGIKKTALEELRPLLEHVDLSPEEKFDTYLMLIRSTDDTTLIDPAYAAAHAISDEKRKAQALLDIVKEIDFLSHPQQ